MQLTEDIVVQAFPRFTDKNLIKEITSEGSLHSFDADDIVVDTGLPIPFVPLIIKGNLKVLKHDERSGNELLLYYLKTGDTCATSISCCMNSAVSEVEVIAEEDSLVLGLPPKNVDHWVEKYPEWKAFIMGTYKSRFDELLETINSIAFTQLDQRLAKYLDQLAKVQKTSQIKTSHQEIAVNLNSSREVISRLLKQMEKRGMVKLSRNTIELLT